jgi:acetolactate synthase small subunit
MENQFAVPSRISIYASDTNSVLSRLLQLFGKSRFAVTYMQVFDTEDENLKLIIVEASFPNEMMSLIISRIEKIIEVHRAFPHQDEDTNPDAVRCC